MIDKETANMAMLLIDALARIGAIEDKISNLESSQTVFQKKLIDSFNMKMKIDQATPDFIKKMNHKKENVTAAQFDEEREKGPLVKCAGGYIVPYGKYVGKELNQTPLSYWRNLEKAGKGINESLHKPLIANGINPPMKKEQQEE